MADGEHQEWELEDEEEFYAEEEKDFHEAWDTEAGWISDVHSLSLKNLTKVGYPSSTGPKNEGRTGIRSFPKGLRLCLDEITDMHRNISLTKIEKITYCHGLAIVTHDPRIEDMCALYKHLRRKAWEIEDFTLIDMLEVKTDAYKFARDAPNSNTSIGILHDRDGLVSRLSRRLGMTNAKLYPCLMVVSVMTWPNGRWRQCPQWPLRQSHENSSIPGLPQRYQTLMVY